ncbi:tRNA nucleotidyltransferase, A-adding, partial [hydrothermal vent metagenome]
MKIITTHLQADFDCVASMMAAKKLYPDAIILFPGSQEKNVRNYLAETGFPLPYRRLKGFRLDDVRQVIIVDASTRERIGVFADLLTREGVTVHLYDHHPANKADIKSDFSVIKNRGSTCTVFVEIFREKNIDISPDEATLLALGIYEDTGSLTFSSTRKEDYEAAGWLLEKGADLAVVSHHISRELTAVQVETLNTLLKNIETRNIEGIQVSVTTASTSRYVGDIAVLLNKIMEMENINVLFTLIRMEDRVHLIARSRVEGMNAGEVAEGFGGGGHPTAASATIKEMTLPQTLGKLWEKISDVVEPAPNAGEMMIASIIKTSPDETIKEAEARLTRFDINAMPVVKQERVVGLITRQIVEKAIYHEMEEHPVSDFMTSEFSVVNRETPAYVLEDIMLGRRQKLTPVVKSDTGKIIGIVTRGTLLNKLYKESLLKPALGVKRERGAMVPASKNMAGMMRERLPENIIKLLNIVADIANK